MRSSLSQSLWTADIIDPFLHVKQILYIHTLLSLYHFTEGESEWALENLWLSKSLRLVPVAHSRNLMTCGSSRYSFFLQKNSGCWWLLGSLQQLTSISAGFLCHGLSKAASCQSNLSVPEQKGQAGTISCSASFILKTESPLETSSRLQPTFPC